MLPLHFLAWLLNAYNNFHPFSKKFFFLVWCMGHNFSLPLWFVCRYDLHEKVVCWWAPTPFPFIFFQQWYVATLDVQRSSWNSSSLLGGVRFLSSDITPWTLLPFSWSYSCPSVVIIFFLILVIPFLVIILLEFCCPFLGLGCPFLGDRPPWTLLPSS